jgi:hypothetical protein
MKGRTNGLCRKDRLVSWRYPIYNRHLWDLFDLKLKADHTMSLEQQSEKPTLKDCLVPFPDPDPDPTLNAYTSTIRSLSTQLYLGSITSVQLVTSYLRQIELHNPRLKALIHVASREGLVTLAREMDEERRGGKSRGALHGIPIVVKYVLPFPPCIRYFTIERRDNIETHPELGMPTTAGSYALRTFSSYRRRRQADSSQSTCRSRPTHSLFVNSAKPAQSVSPPIYTTSNSSQTDTTAFQ